jgi:60 kDa SS-A/Ro ribonucleoprotein
MSNQTYTKALTTIIPNQMRPIIGRSNDMIRNSADGYGFRISNDKRLLRFLILGADTNYYKSGTLFTMENIDCLQEMILDGSGLQALEIVKSVYMDGRAAKQDSTMLAFAILARANDVDVRRATFLVVTEFRTLSQLYMFKSYHKLVGNLTNSSGGWGRLPKNALCNWVKRHDAISLAYQVFKYGKREGWSLRDLLRCCHLKAATVSPDLQLVLKAVVRGFGEAFEQELNHESESLVKISTYLHAINDLKLMTEDSVELVPEICNLVRTHNLPREMLPTWTLKYANVWLTLLLDQNSNVVMPLTALIRNLGVMTSHDLFLDYDVAQAVCNKITNDKVIASSRIHPVTLLTAKMTYGRGCGLKGSLLWSPHPDILASLETAFYMSFGNIERTGKRIFHAIDGSGSMMSSIPTLPIMTACQACAVLAMTFSRSEDPRTQKFGIFTSVLDNSIMTSRSRYSYQSRRANGFKEIVITPSMKLEDSIIVTQITDWSGTDCSLPITKAIELFTSSNGTKGLYDAFIIYTDNDTWAGETHPSQELVRYRSITGITNAKMIVVATTASDVSIADQNDPNMMDVVGFDSMAPQIVSDFIRELF